MRRLATLRRPDTPTTGSELHRLAVRALVRRTGRLLLVESADGDLALPGGGVEPGESLEDALRREVREETGAVVREVTGAFGEVVEHSPAREPDVDVFTMTSRYFTCHVHDEVGAQTLDDYERDLRLTPVWLETAAALARLREAAGSTWRRSPRDLVVLEHLVAEDR
jgi:8-oxo-dGTP pyrophosphatase MutT (NUDIX family)